MSRPLPVRALTSAVIVFIVWATVALVRSAGLLQPLELDAYDLLYAGSAQHDTGTAGATLLWIGDEEEAELGAPLPDRLLAEVLERVLAEGPRAVGMDLYRDLPVADRDGRTGRAELDAVLAGHPNLYAVFKFGGIAPPAALAGSERIGFSDFTYDAGGFLRRGLFYLDDGRRLYSSLALRLALHLLTADGITPQSGRDHPENLRLGAAELPPLDAQFGPYVRLDARGYQFLLTFPARGAQLRHVSVRRLLAGNYRHEDFANRIVVLGSRSEAGKDHFITPYSRWLEGDQRVYGAEAHALAALQIVAMARGELPVPRSLHDGQELALVFIAALLGGVLGNRVRSALRQAFWLAAAAGLTAFATLAAFDHGVVLTPVPVLLALAGSAALVTAESSYWERRERGELMRLLAGRVSPELAEIYWNERAELLSSGRLASRELTATVLFSDLRNFTSHAERIPPPELMRWLSAYSEAMLECVFHHHGYVDKLMGDGLMAVFGVPRASLTPEAVRSDAAAACACAQEMAHALAAFNRRWTAEGFPELSLRIGLCTGPLVAGTVGGSAHQEYTVIGDTVNTAARIESFDKGFGAELPCRILAAQSTVLLLDPARFSARAVGTVELKGKAQHVPIFLIDAQEGRHEARTESLAGSA